MSRAAAIVVLSLIATISVVTGLACGSVHIPLAKLFSALVQPGGDAISGIVWKLRLPRVLAAFACGALLALAGTLLQVLLRNPLADPYVLGISGGAALGALAAMAFGLGLAAVNLAAFCGALGAIVLVFGLSYRSGDWNRYRLLLTGVVLSAGFSAVGITLLVGAAQITLHGRVFLLMGGMQQGQHICRALGTVSCS